MLMRSEVSSCGCIPLSWRRSQRRRRSQRVCQSPVLFCCASPPFQLRQCPPGVCIPPGLIFLSYGCSILCKNRRSFWHVHHCADGQCSELGQRRAQRMCGPRAAPLPRTVAHNPGRFEREQRAPEMVQQIQQRWRWCMVVFRCPVHVLWD